ncbi:MAG: hypothetical protein WBP81_04295 [Solirubrobacteraceae bacterium]
MGKSETHEILSQTDLKPHQVRSWLTSLDPDFDTNRPAACTWRRR